jgi:DNA-binding response OmpR family regulator
MEEDVARIAAKPVFDDHITKPVNFQKLEVAIRQLAARRNRGQGAGAARVARRASARRAGLQGPLCIVPPSGGSHNRLHEPTSGIPVQEKQAVQGRRLG